MALFGKQMQPTQPMTDAEKMAQIMQGNLSGQLSGSDKLLALSSLLRSVSRGRTQTPDQVFQNIQQQKLQEVQGRLQIDQLRKQAQRQAQGELLRQQLIAQEKDPRRKALLEMSSAEDIGAIAREEFKYRDPNQGLTAIEGQLARRFGYGTPEYNRLLDEYLSKDQYMTGPGGGVYRVPGLSIGRQPSPQGSGQAQVDPELIAEATRRGII